MTGAGAGAADRRPLRAHGQSAIATLSDGTGVPRARQRRGSGSNVEARHRGGVAEADAFGRFPGPRWPHDRHGSAGDCPSASGDSRPGLRRRVALTFMAVVLGACVVAAALLFSHALNERQAIRDRALSTAVALSFGFDQEVAAVNYLLKGLSKSPALLSGDIKGFYEQMKATPVPEGSWLILQDLEGQVANTLRPFGDPTAAEAYGVPQLSRADRPHPRAGLVRVGAPVRPREARRHHRAQPSDRRPRRRQMKKLDHHDPVGCAAGRHPRRPDRAGRVDEGRLRPRLPAHRDREEGKGLEIPAPAALRTRLADAGPNSTMDGVIEDVDERGRPVLSPTAAPGRRTGRPPSPCRSPLSTRRSRAFCGRWPGRRRSSSSPAASPPCSRPVRSSARCGRSRTWSRRPRARSPNSRSNCSPCRRRSASASPASCTTRRPSTLSRPTWG